MGPAPSEGRSAQRGKKDLKGGQLPPPAHQAAPCRQKGAGHDGRFPGEAGPVPSPVGVGEGQVTMRLGPVIRKLEGTAGRSQVLSVAFDECAGVIFERITF